MNLDNDKLLKIFKKKMKKTMEELKEKNEKI